jgi:hypothetical protein
MGVYIHQMPIYTPGNMSAMKNCNQYTVSLGNSAHSDSAPKPIPSVCSRSPVSSPTEDPGRIHETNETPKSSILIDFPL